MIDDPELLIANEYKARLRDEEIKQSLEKVGELKQELANLRSDLSKLLDLLENDLLTCLSKLRSFQVFKN